MSEVIEDVDKYTLIDPEKHADIYELVEELVAAHHDHLAEARIALVWVHNVKPDRDGHLVLGKARKISQREQLWNEHDFSIELNEFAWRELKVEQRRALVDHELCHLAVDQDEETEEETFRIRKHDLEEFNAVVRRHGLWREEAQTFVDAALKREKSAAQRELLEKDSH